MPARNLIFIHIPKAAGTTLRKILKTQYPNKRWLQIDGSRPQESFAEFKNKDINERKEIRCLFGHIPYGVHEALVGSSQYITILRHPVERIISHYYYILRQPSHYLYQQVAEKKLSLKDYVTSGLSSQELENGQTWLISGKNYNNSESLAIAKQNLQKHFIGVGITEQFDRSLAIFQQRLGWQKIDYESANVTPNRPQRNEISPEIITLIEKLNYLDMELYDFANLLFTKSLQD
ncbi:MAG: sulfotransferase family 2 domain-containing protein [Pleurocapsa sp.]